MSYIVILKSFQTIYSINYGPNNLWRSSGKQFGATTFSCLY
jgi:hypothetical protein